MSVQGLKSGVNQALRADTSPRYVPPVKVNDSTAAGFLGSIDEEVWKLIGAATVVTLCIEVTAPTRFHPAERVSNWTSVAGVPWQTYRGMHPGVCANSRPRVRTVSVKLDGSCDFCFDWDLLPIAQRTSVLATIFDPGKIVVGHDLASTLSWLFWETDARPSQVVDTLLVMQQTRPGVLYNLHAWAASEDEPVAQAAALVLLNHKGKPALTLSYLAACLKVPVHASGMELNAAWALNTLSKAHHRHCVQTLDTTHNVAARLTKAKSKDSLVHVMTEFAVRFGDYSTATVRLAEAHVRGVPFDREVAERMREGVPTGSALPTELSRPQNTLLRSWLRAAEDDGRLHSMVTFRTLMGRTSSRHPSLQALPRDLSWRRLVRAREGHLMLSVDYSAMELRVAAALAARAVENLEDSLSHCTRDDWWLNLVALGRRSADPFPFPRSAEMAPPQWNRLATLFAAQKVLGGGEQAMRTVLQRGSDPHLVTAAEFARRGGTLTFEGSPDVWFAGLSSERQRELKSVLAAERQSAKACNFGLLYGMSGHGLHIYGTNAYGLTWSLTDAEQAREAWFQLYPELLLWQLWTDYCQSRPARRDLRFYAEETSQLCRSQWPVKCFETTTLAGRPVFAFRKTQALAGQGQGTGADILAKVLARLPQEVADMFVLPVHDELLFEVPASEVTSVQTSVEEIMVQAAEDVIKCDIPITLDSSASLTWS